MMEHSTNCAGINLESTSVSTLDMEMHCICGFSSSEGNALARHLATCERRSAYPTTESVQENTVKRNMLDMLGLVRRDDEDESDDLLQPADVPNRGSGTGNVVNATDSVDSDDEQSASPSLAPPPAPINESGNNEVGANHVATNDEPMDASDAQQFNTQLSLDDLAPPSVAPQPETDRTPQLSDEYQVNYL